MRSGKDTAADTLAACAFQDGRPTFRRASFAGALKDELAQMYGVTREFIDTHKDNFRLILQGHGTEYRRKLFGDDYWINRLEADLVSRPAGICVITDVRFPNEAQFVKDRGGIVVRIQRGETLQPDTHPSEIALDDWDFDFVLFNTGDLGEFQETLKTFWATVVLPIVNGQASAIPE